MRDRKAERYAATRTEILDAAWDLVREHGVAGLSLRDLGHRVGMRAQSLYSYFDSKHAMYDAMFADGYRELLRRFQGLEETDDPRADFKRGVRLFFDFCTEDPARYQLLFQRTIPGFEPSAESYVVSVESYDLMRERFRRLGIEDGRSIDLYTALMTGLTDQQISNDPGGHRWEALLDEASDMYLDHVVPRARRRARKGGPR